MTTQTWSATGNRRGGVVQRITTSPRLYCATCPAPRSRRQSKIIRQIAFALAEPQKF